MVGCLFPRAEDKNKRSLQFCFLTQQKAAADILVCFHEGKINRELSLKLVPNPSDLSFLDSSKVKPTIATSGTVPTFVQYKIRINKRPLDLNRSLTQKHN